MFLENEKDKNIILTYQLEQAQLDVLCHILEALNFHGTLTSVNEPECVLTIPHRMAFLNFASLDEARAQTFFSTLQMQAQKRLFEQPGKSKLPFTYVLHCKTVATKIPNIFVNKDVFGDNEKLRLMLLQKIKEKEGKKENEPISDRLIRLLQMYNNILYYCSLVPRGDISSRRFYQDMAIIKMLVPDIQYDKRQKKYTATYLPDKEETRKVVIGANISARIKRVLLIYQQLLYEGWITKEVADTLDKPISLRMFQRDLKAIDFHAEKICYDMEQQKYVLAARIKQDRYSSRFRNRCHDSW